MLRMPLALNLVSPKAGIESVVMPFAAVPFFGHRAKIRLFGNKSYANLALLLYYSALGLSRIFAKSCADTDCADWAYLDERVRRES